jgi:hypothetical protein
MSGQSEIYDLFKDSLGSLGCIMSNGKMISE